MSTYAVGACCRTLRVYAIVVEDGVNQDFYEVFELTY